MTKDKTLSGPKKCAIFIIFTIAYFGSKIAYSHLLAMNILNK